MRAPVDAKRIRELVRRLARTTLSKIERGFQQDLEDVAEMIERGLVDPARALALFAEIEPSLHRYPAIDPATFRANVERALRSRPG